MLGLATIKIVQKPLRLGGAWGLEKIFTTHL